MSKWPYIVAILDSQHHLLAGIRVTPPLELLRNITLQRVGIGRANDAQRLATPEVQENTVESERERIGLGPVDVGEERL